ncbi:MAG: hypothetical protein WC467_03350 [Patescibacteria group bacterium]
MKKAHHSILYIVIFLLVAGGVALYLWRNEALVFMSDTTGLSQAASTPKVTAAPSNNALDMTIFTAPKFLSLKNNVVKFDFDNICKTPVGRVESVATSSNGTLATTTSIINCIVGNNLPFPLPLKKE